MHDLCQMHPILAALIRPLVSGRLLRIICILGAALFLVSNWSFLRAIVTEYDDNPGPQARSIHGDQYPLQQHRDRTLLTVNPASFNHKIPHPYIDPTFATFACEERSFIFYAGPSGEPNVFSRNLLNEVAKRTGVKPIIRVGGTSLYAI